MIVLWNESTLTLVFLVYLVFIFAPSIVFFFLIMYFVDSSLLLYVDAQPIATVIGAEDVILSDFLNFCG